MAEKKLRQVAIYGKGCPLRRFRLCRFIGHPITDYYFGYETDERASIIARATAAEAPVPPSFSRTSAYSASIFSRYGPSSSKRRSSAVRLSAVRSSCRNSRNARRSRIRLASETNRTLMIRRTIRADKAAIRYPTACGVPLLYTSSVLKK